MAATPEAFAEVRHALKRWRKARYEAPSREFVTPLHARQLLCAAIWQARQSQHRSPSC